ncbi:MAG: glycosyltransferase family 4 protein [Planctomycetes bacterium]|nr:glycosyltransferase family 4 protein [Planctomycetota bacterium]
MLGKEHELDGVVVGPRNGDLIRWMTAQGIPYLPDSMEWPDKRRPWVGLYHALKVARWAKKHHVDLIHCNEHDVYPFAKLLRRFLRLPLVCHIRFKVERPFSEWCFGGKYGPDVLLWTSNQQKADSTSAITGIVPEERQHVVHLGIDLERFGKDATLGKLFRSRYQLTDNDILVGTASPLRPRKRVEDFIELIGRLAAVHPRVVGMIAGGEITGDELYRKRIEDAIHSTGLGSRLRWIGLLEPVEPFHHACDISVSTSEYETFGNSVCEAMACGKPVVGYQGGSVGEVVGDAGLIVPTGDLDKLTNAVQSLVINSELRLDMGEQARLRVAKEFSPSRSLQQLHAIYEDLISKSGQPQKSRSTDHQFLR